MHLATLSICYGVLTHQVLLSLEKCIREYLKFYDAPNIFWMAVLAMYYRCELFLYLNASLIKNLI